MKKQSLQSERVKSVQRRKGLSGPILFLIPLVISLILATVVNSQIEDMLEQKLTTIGSLILYVGLYFLLNWSVRKFFARNTTEKVEPHPALSWPMSGPIGKFGHKAMLFTYFPTLILSVLNPVQLLQQIRQTFGLLSVAKRVEGKELFYATYQTKCSYRLPFYGEWLIYHGGVTEGTSHSWNN